MKNEGSAFSELKKGMSCLQNILNENKWES